MRRHNPKANRISLSPQLMNALKGGTLMTETSLSDGTCLSYYNDIPTPQRNGGSVDEAGLIRKIVGGQKDLFGDLIAPHLTALSCVVRAPIGGHPEVEDSVQHTAYKAFIHLAHFRFEARFKTSLIRIGLNEARQWRRKHASLRLIEVTPLTSHELLIAVYRPPPLMQYQRSETISLRGTATAQHTLQ